MKYLSRIILLTLLALTVANSQAQDYVPVQVKPNITYTQDRTRYVLGGLAIDGADDFDEESLLSASGLIVGESYDVPGEDISEVIRRYMQQKCRRKNISAYLSDAATAYFKYQLFRR